MTATSNMISAALARRKCLPWASGAVYNQQEYFYPGTWKAKWPEGLGVPSVLAGVEGGSRTKLPVTRRDVFAAASNVATEEDALNLYVMMCGWGAGVKGRPGYRARLPLAERDIAPKLLRSNQAIRGGENPVSVYRSLASGEFRIKHFGPAFFTKWMYFSGHASGESAQPKPLILDARVAASLGLPPHGWAPEVYAAYLQLSKDVAAELDGREPHVVEHALFVLNGQLDRPCPRVQVPNPLEVCASICLPSLRSHRAPEG